MPDFSGKYILTNVEGDIEDMMVAIGIGWFRRRAAIALGLGVGLVNVSLTQSGNKFKIRSSTPLGSSDVGFTVGGGLQHLQASDGGNFTLEARWVGTEVYGTQKRDDYTTQQRRYLRDPKTMVIETTIDKIKS